VNGLNNPWESEDGNRKRIYVNAGIIGTARYAGPVTIKLAVRYGEDDEWLIPAVRLFDATLV